MYKSPIEIIYDDAKMHLKMHFENDILKAIQHYEIHVDKDELIKALNYDRDQYIKGYNEAVANLQKKGAWIASPLPDDWVGTLYKCSECGSVEDSRTAYCPRCGAKMEAEE